jgi:glycosyltransferase involved in cell wall biosynthesis
MKQKKLKFVLLTPGAGGMFCGGCIRDNALVTEMRRQGYDALMAPLYLPVKVDEVSMSADQPVFFGGISVYLEQQFAWFRKCPRWLKRLLASRWLLKLASGSAAKTRPEDVGELTVSMLQGEAGHQSSELDMLVDWLRNDIQPDVIGLSNALLLGMRRKLSQALGVPIVCFLQGEDTFLDALGAKDREKAWQVLSERAAETELFVSPSVYFADLMARRMNIPREKIEVIPNGTTLEGYSETRVEPAAPTLGYFARMCTDKGVEFIAEVFLKLKERNRVPGLRLHIGGGMGPTDELVVNRIRKRFNNANVASDVDFFPNVTREEKIRFFENITVLSTPAFYGETFGLYLIEGMAAGVPIVQPPVAAFPEIIEKSKGGLLSEDTSVDSLALTIEGLLMDSGQRKAFGEAARASVHSYYSVERMAKEVGGRLETLVASFPS